MYFIAIFTDSWIICSLFLFVSFNQGEDAEISFELLKTEVFVVDINICNSSTSYEDAMRPGMFCAGRFKAGNLQLNQL